MEDCKCEDWIENISKINGAFTMQCIHGGSGYEGKQFVYCPWCGKELSGAVT